MIKVVILALNNAVPSTITSPMEIFKFSGSAWNYLAGKTPDEYFDVKVISMDGKLVTCYGDISIHPNGSARSAHSSDIIIVPSVGVSPSNCLGNKQKEISWLTRQYDKGAKIASICSGAYLLAEAGLLDNKVATTHWGFAAEFQQRYPKVKLKPERTITEDGRIFCSGGVNSSTDLSLYLVEKFAGHQVAMEVSKALLLGPVRTHQTPFTSFEFQKKHSDTKILEIQKWLEKNYASFFSFEDIATNFGMSSRNFKRRFKLTTGDTPLVYLHRLRIEAAKCQLENNQNSIENISDVVGYSDTQFFRKLFKRHAGVTPIEYRKMMQPSIDS